MAKKVVIIGAGPSGLLLAHYLLPRGDCYQIEIYSAAATRALSPSPNPELFP